MRGSGGADGDVEQTQCCDEERRQESQSENNIGLLQREHVTHRVVAKPNWK